MNVSKRIVVVDFAAFKQKFKRRESISYGITGYLTPLSATVLFATSLSPICHDFRNISSSISPRSFIFINLNFLLGTTQCIVRNPLYSSQEFDPSWRQSKGGDYGITEECGESKERCGKGFESMVRGFRECWESGRFGMSPISCARGRDELMDRDSQLL